MRPSPESGLPSGPATGSGPFEFPCSSVRASISPQLSSSMPSRIPPDGPAHGPWVFQLSIIPFVRSRDPISSQRSSSSPLDRMQLRRAVADEDEQVLARSKLLVEARISRVDPEHRGRDEFARCGDDGHVPGSDAAEHGRTDLKIPASEDETLPADGAYNHLGLLDTALEAEG